MTKELTALAVLTAIVLSSWIGWFVFERASVLTEVDFSQKSVQPLDPVLRTEVIRQ